MSEADIQCLKEMGFSEEHGKIALEATRGQGLQSAIEWLFSHPEDSKGHRLVSTDTPDGESTQSAPEQGGTNASDNLNENQEGETGTAQSSKAMQQPLSLVCEECGKQLKTEIDAQAHAARTGHQSFAESTQEIKPMTEVEKKEQLKKLEERLAQRRKERTEAEKQADIEREKVRRKTGKELTEVKQKMEFEEAKRIAEQRRKEKQEEKLLRQKLKEKIAQDRLDQQAKQVVLLGQTPPPGKSQVSPPTTTNVDAVAPRKEYDTCRIQFRLTNGTAMTSNFKPDDRLATVYEYIAANRSDPSGPFSLMTTFPRRTFTDADMESTLRDLGLVPSAVLVLSKT